VRDHKTLKLMLAAVCIIMLAGCSRTIKITNSVDLNYTDAQMDQYTWIGSEIGDFRKITMKEALRLFDEQGSGILYFGYVGCPWCERAVPVLNEAVRETNVTVWYVSTKDTFESSVLDTLKEDLYDALPVDSDGNRGFYVPMVVGVKKGKVTGHHTSLVDGFEIKSSSDQMTDEQKTQLKNLYLDIIKRTAD